MSAETFVFTQLQSGALPTELSEATSPTCLHYLTLINVRGQFGHLSGTAGARGFQGWNLMENSQWLVKDAGSSNRRLWRGRERRG